MTFAWANRHSLDAEISPIHFNTCWIFLVTKLESACRLDSQHVVCHTAVQCSTNTQFVQLNKQKMAKNLESVTKGLQWVYWEGIARGFENRSKWKNAAMKWHYWFHVFTPDRLQTVGPLKENRRIGWEPNIGPLILVCSSFPHICSPPRQQNCHQGEKSLKSLKRHF